MDSPPPPQDAPRPEYKLPGIAFTLSLLSCLVLPLPFAIVLSAVALYSTWKDPRLPHRRLAIASVLLSAFWTYFLLAKFIPNYINFGARARQSECNTNLRALYTAEKVFHSQHQRYTERIAELGVPFEYRTRYAYFLSTRGPFDTHKPPDLASSSPESTGVLPDTPMGGGDPVDASSYVEAIPALAGGVQVGLSGTCPACDITLVCIGDIDGDSELDAWSISTKERQGPEGPIPPGEPFNDFYDLANRPW
ncbi:hypothetical protein [Hyalangium gracile]|uniref:hypothetical protein n=1 Tax=Hyalangium gracile TaxID=394092 RepID=UPI001CCF094F|nr:hypothetical protein [Hyalangium gracile]